MTMETTPMAMEGLEATSPVAEKRHVLVRKLSLASELETMASSGAFVRAVQENRPEVDVCRTILQKKTGKRTLDDIHVVDKLYQSIELGVYDQKGAFVFEQDDPGDSFYMVFRGQAVEIMTREKRKAVTSIGMDNKRSNIHVAFLNPGDSFGERALLYDTDRRAASAVISSNYAELIFINRGVFTDLLKESQDADTTGSTLEITRRFRTNKDIIRNIFMRQSAQRSEKDLKFAVEYLKGVKFFSRFSFEVRKQLCKVMKLISAVTNTILFEEGQVGRHFYIIFSGSVEVSVRTKNRFDENTENVVSRLAEGESFGELALSEDNGVRRATVICADFCELLVLGQDQYEPLIKKYQNEYNALYAQMLRKNAYFIGPEWDDNTIEGMCSVMTEKHIPFRGEICKQGSRASEMFIITRGECVIVHEGKHPITGQPQQYELGRYGPNSVLGCAEASAGKFNDIHTRDYSIIAQSPVKMLVLSRFDIFHLMSPEARASLQRSALGYMRESIESRALKTVAWERYRQEYLTEILSAKEKQKGIGAGRGPISSNTLSKSSSVPVIPSAKALKSLVEPCALVLEVRHSPSRAQSRKLGRIQSPEKAQSERSENSAPGPKPETTAETEARRRHTVPTDLNGTESEAKNLLPVTIQEEDTEVSRDEGSNAEQDSVALTPIRKPRMTRRNSLVKSRTMAVLETVPDPALRRVPSNMDHGNSKLASAALTAPPIWTPIHGVCQPFSVLGFRKERPRPRKITSVNSIKAARSSLLVTSSMKASAAALTEATAATTVSHDEPLVAAFRVMGKFCELYEALNLFAHVCTLETTPPPGKDTSRFAIYKDDEMTMALENFFSGVGSNATPYQYRALDLQHPNAHRFACVSVSLETPTRVIENVSVHVYQCCPTAQSAVRFAKQMSASTLATMTLYVVPLFEWIPLADLDRFDARNADLELAFESILAPTAFNVLSTWKARKEAIKKARMHTLHRK
ncbi:hypothetical protein Poli38472_003380 [Pythium oligandrum]|uniref:Cyclic nucleotide-binding domain-containing protein n=1 Tax=Pythium oligandrum TaxID=41045 RepID=A0A8K1C6Y7_PYTOL|nr:hypothetical protein Poli38472_003380 [Pythium oligandrum]|eukprot:TMW57455.1 hypothetical protein Poli38472_003380 [Pythium oligandrum]